MIRKRQKPINTLAIISFTTGFALMAYELVAARLLAPTIGSSIYVWTSVIGMVIAALSVGYWLGGKLADLRQKQIDVVLLCLLAALGVVMTVLSHSNVLPWIIQTIEDTRLQGVVASLLLFVPTSFILGCIGPYLAKLNIKALETAGESVANLSALNSIGGIIGTFVTGFILFGYIGSQETLIIITVILVASSWLLAPGQRVLQRIILSIAIILGSFIPSQAPANSLARVDTPSAHYEIYETMYNGRAITGLATGPGALQSAVYNDGSDELAFWYTRYSTELITATQPDRVLVLGGGAFTVPTALAKKLPNATIDVVEIDPELESIAKEYFSYEDQPNINLVFEDARLYINTATEKYDVIFVDAYGDSFMPFSLLTKEFGEKIDALTQPDGLVVINAIAGLEGDCRTLMNAIEGTYRPFFSDAYWQTQSGKAVTRGNYILAYSKGASVPSAMNKLQMSDNVVSYTDNFMPAERLHFACQQH